MIYYILPKLIDQPTWGGKYIANHKQWNNLEVLKDKKIGQSYEFFSGSKLIYLSKVATLPNDKLPFYLGSNKAEDETLINSVEDIKTLEELNLTNLFGQNQIPNLLIKFTQAKGNSYQLHTKSRTDKYFPKPESWYFFAPGKVTLGIKKGANIARYKAVCQAIYTLTQQLSEKVKNKSITIDTARKDLETFINQNSPEQFVNVLDLETDAIVDNYHGGIRHSWEEDEIKIPDGNIVYEVQQDVMDDVSTLRSFDKGKFKDDGSYRDLNIDDYFEHLDLSDGLNMPEKLMGQKLKTEANNNFENYKIFKNQYYQMDEVNVRLNFKNIEPGFRHLFVKDGHGKIIADGETYEINQGNSYLIPASIKSWELVNSGREFRVLLSYL